MIPSDETSSQSREHGTSISSTSSSANTDQGPNNPQLNFSRLAYNLPMFNETYEMIQEKSEASRKVIRAVSVMTRGALLSLMENKIHEFLRHQCRCSLVPPNCFVFEFICYYATLRCGRRAPKTR